MAGGIHAPGIFSVGLAGALLCGLLILLAVTPASAATPAPAGPKIKVTPENPYYDLLQAEQRPPIRLNARLKGCRIAPYSDCKGAGLKGQKLYGANLRQADLRKADLTNANLRNADLREARLAKARLGGAKLCRTRMPNGKIRG